MITFILPGFSAHNKDWAEDVAKNLNLPGGKDDQIRPIFWDHWTDPSKTLKPKGKARLIADLAPQRKVNIIAKSVGTLVAAHVIRGIPDQINKLILCGIPTVSDERLKIFKEAFAGIPPEKVICFQNEGDPFAKAVAVSKFLAKVNPKIKVVATPRSDHNYPFFEDFNKFLTS